MYLTSRHDPDLETKFRNTNRDCIEGGALTTNKDNFLSTYLLQDAHGQCVG